MGMRAFRRALVVAVTVAGALAPLGVAGAAQAADASSPVPVGAAWQPPADPEPSGQYGQFASASADPAETAASRQAEATGKAVVVSSLTTATSMVTAEPDGILEASSSVLPVRVRARGGWVPVDTRLRLAGGRLSPGEVPGDSVSFSAGGTSAAAEVSQGASSLSLSWPGSLPAPVVSGSSATYQDVLPGVNLVLTATSEEAGGFTEVLVITSRAAASDEGLSSLAWRVSSPGTSGLEPLRGGGLAAAVSGGHGMFGAAAPVMWDSSAVAPGASPAAVHSALALARSAGAGLASGGMGPKSTTAGPAGGARMAGVGTRVTHGGQSLSLVPDQGLLASPATRFPVYIDPGFSYYDKTDPEQAFDPVQSDCPTARNYDSSIGGFSPVGYDNFGGECSDNDTDYSLYRVGIPSGTLNSDSVLMSASFQVTEVYTSDCSSSVTMTATWTDGIGSATEWPGPGPAAGNSNVTTTLGPDAGSCNTTEDTNDRASAGFNVKNDLNSSPGSATQITFRVWENGNTNEDDHKQLTTNPTLEVLFTLTPATPSSMEEAANSSGSGSLDCATSASSAPRIGKTDATSGLYLLADYSDPDGASVNGNIQYKVSTASSWTVKDAAVSSVAGTEVGWQLPSSVTSGLANGTVMEWEAQAQTGSESVGGTTYGPYTSAWSSPCYFAVYPASPDAPTLTPDFSPANAPQPAGQSISFTITQSAGDTASEFVFGLDAQPVTSGTISTLRLCSTAQAEPKCSQITGGKATLTLPSEPSPGPHNIWVVEIDAGGNVSGTTNGAPSGQATTYSVMTDPEVMFDTAGDSLQQNLTAAEDDTSHSFGNTMISREPGNADGANGDGQGSTLDEGLMKAAGWEPGKTVTVDGATFTLPDFGTTTSGPDNLLSAHELLGADDAQGSALVFLATGTYGDAEITGSVGSGSSDSQALSTDLTAPVTPAGYPAVGSDCNLTPDFDDNGACVPASGEVNYAPGCPAGVTQPYELTVPDWVAGPSDIAALEMQWRDVYPAPDISKDNPKIYAFAVPTDPACQVSSVELPDVGTGLSQPALHIFGMSFRNTTTATPQAGGGQPASPAGQAWTGAYASSIENAYAPPSGDTWGSQTVRIAVSPGVAAAAGSDVRIRLSDPGYWSEDGSGPLAIGAATIAPEAAGTPPSPAASAAPTPLTFGGSASVTVPEGGDIYSDPVPLPFAVAPGQGILVSLYLQTPSISDLPLNNDPSGAMSWFAPSSTPDEAGSQSGAPFTGSGGYATNTVPLLTGLDVTTPEVTSQAPALPGEPTIVVTGDGGIIDGPDNTDIPPDAGNDPSQRLAGQLVAQGATPGFGVVDTSVEDNMLLKDAASQAGAGGLALEYRLDHDVLAEPDLGTVIINAGLQDILASDGAATAVTGVTDALNDTAGILNHFGVGEVFIDSLTPCAGYSSSAAGDTCDLTADGGRIAVNSGISQSGLASEADFATAVTESGTGAETGTQGVLKADDGAGDGANLSFTGYADLATWWDNTCGPAAPPTLVLPPT